MDHSIRFGLADATARQQIQRAEQLVDSVWIRLRPKFINLKRRATRSASQSRVLEMLRRECGMAMGVKRLRACTAQLSDALCRLPVIGRWCYSSTVMHIHHISFPFFGHAGYASQLG